MTRSILRSIGLVAVLVGLATAGLAPGFQPAAHAICPDPSDTGGFGVGCGDDNTTDPHDDPSDGGGGGGGGGPRVCKVPGGAGLPEYKVDCTTAAGAWSDDRLCYLKVEDPPPAKDDPVWEGNDDGYVVRCSPSEAYCNDVAIPNGTGGRACLEQVVGWQQNPPGVDPVNPEVIARQVFANMPLHAIDIGIVPESGPGRVGLVGMPVWMWAQDPGTDQLGHRTASATDQGLTVTLDAKVDKVVWDMGDGRTVTCDGSGGTPYEDRFGRAESPDCGYRFTRQGQYTVTATTYWTATWTGGDQSGQLTNDFTATTQVSVGELQVITQ